MRTRMSGKQGLLMKTNEALLAIAQSNVLRDHGLNGCHCCDVSPCWCSIVQQEYVRLAKTGRTS